MVETYVNYISDAECMKYIRRQSEDLAVQYWHTIHLTMRLLCGIQTPASTKTLPFITDEQANDTIEPFSLRNIHVKESNRKNHGKSSQNGPFCCKHCIADEYHSIMVYAYFRDQRVELLPEFDYLHPIIMLICPTDELRKL